MAKWKPRSVRRPTAAERDQAPKGVRGWLESPRDRDAFISQHSYVERLEERDPLVGARVIFVIAGDEEDAVFCA